MQSRDITTIASTDKEHVAQCESHDVGACAGVFMDNGDNSVE